MREIWRSLGGIVLLLVLYLNLMSFPLREYAVSQDDSGAKKCTLELAGLSPGVLATEVPDDVFYRGLYLLFQCMIEELVLPYISSNITLAAQHAPVLQPTDCDASVEDYGETSAQRFRTLAHRNWCVLQRLLPESLARGWRTGYGLHIKNAAVLRERLAHVRKCSGGLVACVVIKNEGRYIQEWLAFHIVQGYEHFYVYLNEIQDDTVEALQPFVDVGLVTVNTVEGRGVQCDVTTRCLNHIKATSGAQWVAMQDADEYLFRTDHGCIAEAFDDYTYAAALTVNWRIYSFGAHIMTIGPRTTLMESNVLTRTQEEPPRDDVHVKSIVNVNKTVDCRHPHYCAYVKPYVAVNEDHEVVNGPFQNPPVSRRLRMHHYWGRSVEDYLLKRFRGRAGAKGFVGFELVVSNLRYLLSLKHAETEDIAPAVEPVRRLLGLPVGNT